MADYKGAYRYTRMAGGDVYAATRRDGASNVYVGYAHRVPGGWRYSPDGEHVTGRVCAIRDDAIARGLADHDPEAVR